MSRTRSSGSSSLNSFAVPYVNVQTKSVYTGIPPLYFERQFREIPGTDSFWTYDESRQNMTDVVGERGMYNPVSHIKRYGYPMPTGNGSKYIPTFTGYNPIFWDWAQVGMKIGAPSGGQISFQRQHSSGSYLPIPVLASPDWSSLVDAVGQQLDGHITTGQNLVVSLAQIGQVVGMLKNPFNLKALKKLPKSMTLRQVAKSGASKYLEYEFGWLNFKRDIEAVASVWSEVRAHRAYLEKTANRYVPLSKGSTIVSSNNPGVGVFLPVGSPSRVEFTPQITSVERTDCFSLDVMRQESALALSTMDQVLARLGVNDLATALWDLVPYSFVVDWFTHINRVMERQSTSWNSYDLRRVGYSSKTKWFGRLKCVSNADGYGGSSWQTWYTDPMCVQTEYVRYPGFPPSTATVGLFGNLSSSQIAQGVALIVQRL